MLWTRKKCCCTTRTTRTSELRYDVGTKTRLVDLLGLEDTQESCRSRLLLLGSTLFASAILPLQGSEFTLEAKPFKECPSAIGA